MTRILMEASQHSENAFLTLTYSDEALDALKDNGEWMRRTSEGVPTLVPRDLQLFLKNFRWAIQPAKIRFYAVGEYGDQGERPHYHAILFGYAHCLRGSSLFNRHTGSCCVQCDRVQEVWKAGFVHLGGVTAQSARYVAGYVMKKMTARDDARLRGRHPEFARSSNRPGIGKDAMWDVASAFLQYNETAIDVPLHLDVGGRAHPLGRYLREQLRMMVGRDKKTPEAVLNAMADELSTVRSFALAQDQKTQEVLVDLVRGKLQRFEALERINKRKHLL